MTNDQRPMFVDSHAHLETEQFEADREQVIARAREAGIETILAIGSGNGPGTLDCAIRLAEQHDFIYATVGIHPHEAKQASDADFEELAQLAKRPKVIAWGEIGLGLLLRSLTARHTATSISEAVGACASGQAAHRHSLQAVGRQRECVGRLPDAVARTLVVNRPRRDSALFHRNLAHAKRALDMGFNISFAGNITFPKAQQIRDAAKEVPLDRILIETDSPFLAPVPHRGKRNEPAFVNEVARQIGEIRDQSTEEIGLQTANNFYRFFSLHEKLNSI